MNIKPPFIQYWLNNKKNKFYLFEQIELIFKDGCFIKNEFTDKKDISSPCLLITPCRDFVEISVKNSDDPLFLLGAKRKKIKSTNSLFFVFLNIEFFIDGLDFDDAVFSTTGLVCDSFISRYVVDTALSFARTDYPIFIVGDTGTGKEVLAKNIHYNSLRKNQRCNVLHCPNLEEQTTAYELFGSVKGAYTNSMGKINGIFMNSINGTLIIDDIASLSLSTQAMLLRCLEYNEVKQLGSDKVKKHNVRLILLSNVMSQELLDKKLIRKDFFYRIEKCLIELPLLKNRKEDLPRLIRYFLGEDVKISLEALDLLYSYDWPGNIRELKYIVQKASILSCGKKIEKKHIDIQNYDLINKSQKHTMSKTLLDFETNLILQVLKESNYNYTKASIALGISRTTLINKMKKIA